MQPATPRQNQRRMVTAIVIVATLLVASVVFNEVNSKTGPRELVLDVVVGALGCGLLLIGLFRWPIPSAITLAALSPTATPLSTAATLQSARGQRANVAGWVALAGVVGHALYGLWRPMPGLSYAWWLDKIINACEGCDDGEVVFGGKVAQLDDAG